MGLFLKKSIRAAVIQSLIVQGEVERNLTSAFSLFDKALEQKPRIVSFTQTFGTGTNFVVLRKMAEPVPGGRIDSLIAEKARRYKIYISAGILELGGDARIYDCHVLYSPQGDLIGKYRRWSLWHGERNYVSQGERINCIPTEIGTIGLFTGYDMCFPGSISHYMLQDVDILVCAGTIFQDLSYNVQTLCSTRSMDFHCYLIFASGIGEHQFANMKYMGNSAITCDPYFMVSQKLVKHAIPGIEVMAKAATKEEVIFADLYVEELAKSRKHLSFIKDLRSSINNVA